MIKSVQKIYKHFEQFALYSVGGGLAFIVDFSLLYVLTEHFGFWYMASNAVSVTAAIVVNYCWQRLVTFKSTDRGIAKQFSKFVVISLVGLGLNMILLYLLVAFVGLWYLLAKVIVTIMVWFWNFFGNKYFTFKTRFAYKVIRESDIPA